MNMMRVLLVKPEAIFFYKGTSQHGLRQHKRIFVGGAAYTRLLASSGSASRLEEEPNAIGVWTLMKTHATMP
jgi:hypothetical protein